MSEEITAIVKDPDAVRSFAHDWSVWLDEGDLIATSVWLASVPAGLTLTNPSNTTTTATVWVSGGTDGVDYEITNRITTVGGQTDDRTSTIMVRQQ